MVVFDKPTHEKLLKEVPTYKLITPSVLVDRLRISGSLARAAIIEMEKEGLVKAVSMHGSQRIYTRATKVFYALLRILYFNRWKMKLKLPSSFKSFWTIKHITKTFLLK